MLLSKFKLKPRPESNIRFDIVSTVSSDADELAKNLAYQPEPKGNVQKRNLFVVGRKALYVQQEVTLKKQNNQKIQKRKPTPRNPLEAKLIKLAIAKDKELFSVLEENDPGLLIMWQERSCKSCGSVKRQWAEKVLNTCPEVVEFLGETPEEF